MERFIRRMNTLAILHIGMIGEDMEHTQYIENLAFDLMYWSKCLDWSNLGENEIKNRFNDEQIQALINRNEKDIDEFIENMFNWEKWEKEEPFVIETDEITRNIIKYLKREEELK